MGFAEDTRSPIIILASLASLMAGGVSGCGAGTPSPQTRSRTPISDDQRARSRIWDDEATDDDDESDGEGDGDESSAQSGNARSVTIRWAQAIDSRAFGLAPNPKIDGKSLAQIVTGQDAGRDDGKLCSECHNEARALGGYGLAVAENASVLELDPWAVVGTTFQQSWAGDNGWAEKFVSNSTKPANVKAVFRAWIRSGFK
jgi:hypothetical protein